jgi:hypothetical protein
MSALLRRRRSRYLAPTFALALPVLPQLSGVSVHNPKILEFEVHESNIADQRVSSN